MPTFQGLISEEGILQLVAYVKSLSHPVAVAGTEILPPANRTPAPNRPGTEPGPKNERKP